MELLGLNAESQDSQYGHSGLQSSQPPSPKLLSTGRSKPVDAAKLAARQQLNEALLELPEEYCTAIREAMAAFAARKVWMWCRAR